MKNYDVLQSYAQVVEFIKLCQSYEFFAPFMSKLSNYVKLCQFFQNLPKLCKNYEVIFNYAKVMKFFLVYVEVIELCQIVPIYEVLPKLSCCIELYQSYEDLPK
jgi:hypothetical protein